MNQLSNFTGLPKSRLKLAVAIGLAFLLSCLYSAQSQTLVWQENFDSTGVNTNAWTYDFGNGSERPAGWGWGNQELEYYTSRSQNVRVENGSLVIEAIRENFQGSAFTSGRIKTEGRIHFKYGTIEARIKLPNLSNGLWPAFWTLGTIGGSWPSIGEIDMMEVGAAAALAAGKGNRQVSSAAHWSDATGAHQFNTSNTEAAVDLSADYHLYKMVWTSQSIKMYLDNVEFYTFDISGGAAANLSEFHTPHFLLLNLAVGGQYTGIFNESGITAPLPGKMLVDYIKLYQNPGDVLFIGDNNAKSGNFGVLTETTPVADSLSYGTNATLYYWNNLTNINNAVPFEGSHLLAVHANSGDWFGMGVDNNYVNLNNFGTGSLKFHFKSSYAGQYKIGLKTGHGETWMNFPASTQKYGLIRDGNWHEVSIPLADFNNGALGMNIDLYSVKGAFMFAGDPAAGAADFYFDNIYFSGGILSNPPPTVSITSPGANAIFTVPSSVTINADAADANGTITKVDFYSGSTLLGTDVTSPYSFTWNSPTVGVDTLTAVATDDGAAVTTSAPVIIFVSAAGNTPPTAAITSPADNAAFLTPSPITINATATDAGGAVYKVDFYNGTTLLGTSTTSPYSYVWNGVTAGNYTITVKATDNGGLTTTSGGVNISVTDPIKPTVSITSPADGASFLPPASITITADAADANGTVTKVDFYNGNTLLGTDLTSPYSYSWTSVPLGNYSITAKATDNDNNETVSAAVNIIVAPYTCTGTATNGDYSYEVYTNAGTVYFKFHPLAPIAGSNLAILALKEGAAGGFSGYGMTASGADFVYSKAIADGTALTFYFTYNTPPAGERNSSANPHTYTVGNVCIPGAPTVSITSPADATSFVAPASITIEATAADPGGSITKVDFYNGNTLLGTDNTSPYSYTWTGVPAGPYVLTAKATDNSSLTTTSNPVNVTVNTPNVNGYCGTAVSGDYEFKAETAGGIVTFTMHPLAPIAGCAYALIYVREGLSGGYPGYAMTASGSDFIFSKTIADATPVSFYFTYQTPPAGERNSAANPHSYTVGSNCTGATGTPPTISITSPVNNATYTEIASITFEASVSDADGTISKVEFYNGANLLGTDNTSPYSYNWTGVAAGNYTITAKATDNLNLTATSSLINVVVNINNSGGFCGTLANGDYSYKAETANGNVTFTFHPEAPIAGSNSALIYVREGLSGGYPGYAMTPVGSDFRFTKAFANGTPLSIYFTYNVPGFGDRNSSATPHSYTVGTNCLSTLPVSVINFAISKQSDGNVGITWSTASEQNNDHFLVEKSLDGTSFSPIEKVTGQSNSSIKIDYKVVDKNTVNGRNYYRLSQVDKDGRFTVIGTKAILISGRTAGISLYPNPLSGTQINIKLAEPTVKKLSVQITNIAGKVMYNGMFTAQGNTLQVTLPVKPIAGIYLLKVEGNTPLKLILN